MLLVLQRGEPRTLTLIEPRNQAWPAIVVSAAHIRMHARGIVQRVSLG